ncbi:hypothetical protein GCM10009526_18610 [Glutamicibacter creatinolyticus]
MLPMDSKGGATGPTAVSFIISLPFLPHVLPGRIRAVRWASEGIPYRRAEVGNVILSTCRELGSAVTEMPPSGYLSGSRALWTPWVPGAAEPEL